MIFRRIGDILEDVNIMIKYCGGCNPRYDRIMMVKRVEKDYLLKQYPIIQK